MDLLNSFVIFFLQKNFVLNNVKYETIISLHIPFIVSQISFRTKYFNLKSFIWKSNNLTLEKLSNPSQLSIVCPVS